MVFDYARQLGLPARGAGRTPSFTFFQGFGHVLRRYPKQWRVDVRDSLHGDVQPVRAMVLGNFFPPVHAPDEADGEASIVLYGFIGARRNDAWCVPVHALGLTGSEREDNVWFLRLLGVTMRIGKSGDDTVLQFIADKFEFTANVNTGAVVVKGAVSSSGSADVEIDANGKIHAKAKTGQTVEADDGTGAVSLTKLTEHNTHGNTVYAPHKHTVPMVGTSGPPDIPFSAATGTTVLKGK